MKPDKYTNKTGSLILEAVQVLADNVSEISNWANGAQIVTEKDALSGDPLEALNVKTPDGMKRASRGAFVVKYGNSLAVVDETKFLSKYKLVSGTPKPPEIIERKATSPVKDPWKGITRMNEGPKP